MTYADQIRAMAPKAREAMSGLSDDQINLRSAPGEWSIAECVAHLNKTNELYASAIERSIAEARRRGWVAEGEPKLRWFERWFVRKLEPPVTRRTKAPQVFIPEPTTYVRDELLARWVATHQYLADIAEEARDLNLSKAKVPSPAMPLWKFSVLCAFQLICAHDRRHLWQMERIRAGMASRSEA